jgi:ribosomal protein S18 acetylase RimI-like enzyme
MRLATQRQRTAALDLLAPDTIRAVTALLHDLPRDYPGAESWLKRRLRDSLNGEAESWIAEVDGWPAGVVILTPKTTALKLSTIYVEPRFRGCGVGALLMDHALERAALHRIDETYVTVAHHTVPLLQPLLDSRGFARVALERHRYGWGRHEAIFSRLQG